LCLASIFLGPYLNLDFFCPNRFLYLLILHCVAEINFYFYLAYLVLSPSNLLDLDSSLIQPSCHPFYPMQIFLLCQCPLSSSLRFDIGCPYSSAPHYLDGHHYFDYIMGLLFREFLSQLMIAYKLDLWH